VGGAPPPPRTLHRRGPKTRKNSTLKGSDFGGLEGPEDQSPQGGEGGPATTQAELVGEGGASSATTRRERDPHQRSFARGGGWIANSKRDEIGALWSKRPPDDRALKR